MDVAVIPVILPNGTRIDAKLDTGAEYCCINHSYLLGQDPNDATCIDRRRFSGLTGDADFDIYFTRLEIDGRSFEVEVVAGNQQRNVIGMNLLNQLVAEFNGPMRQASL